MLFFVDGNCFFGNHALWSSPREIFNYKDVIVRVNPKIWGLTSLNRKLLCDVLTSKGLQYQTVREFQRAGYFVRPLNPRASTKGQIYTVFFFFLIFRWFNIRHYTLAIYHDDDNTKTSRVFIAVAAPTKLNIYQLHDKEILSCVIFSSLWEI